MKLEDLVLELAGNKDLKQKFITNPRGVLAERGISVPEGVTLKVLEDTASLQHIVLPHLSSAGKHAPEELEKRTSKTGIVVPQ
jgi:hypothetical protein